MKFVNDEVIKTYQNLFFKDIFLFFIKESCRQIWMPVKNVGS